MSVLDIAERDGRYLRLVSHYGPGFDFPAVEDLGQARYVLVQTFGWEGFARTAVAFVAAQDLPELFEWAGGEVLDGWLPEAIFDLADGRLIDLHVTTPVVSAAEDQGVTANPLADAAGVTG